MRRISAVLLGLVSVGAFVGTACKKDPPPPVAPVPSAQPYPSAQPGQPGYPQQPPPGYPSAQPAPATMAVPGPAALPCSNDSQCMTHKCNVQYGKCAFPCQTDGDCIQGATCFTGGGAMAACIPKPQ